MRRRATLKYIADAKARKASYKKRKKGILKKMGEISSLCGLKACAVICSPYDEQPVVWPDPEEARQVVDRYKNMPQMEQNKRQLDLEGVMKQMVIKASDHVKRLRVSNRDMELNQVMKHCLTGSTVLGDLDMIDLLDFNSFLNEKLHEIDTRIELLKRKERGPTVLGEPASKPPTPPPTLPPTLPPALSPAGLVIPDQVWVLESSLVQNSDFKGENMGMDNSAMQIQPSVMDINMLGTDQSNQMAADYGNEAMNPTNQTEGLGVDNMLEGFGSPTLDFGANPTWLDSFHP